MAWNGIQAGREWHGLIIWRLVGLDIKKPHGNGIAKVMATLVSLVGVLTFEFLTVTLYKGATIKCSWEFPIHLTRGDF